MNPLIVATFAMAAGISCARVRGIDGRAVPAWKRLGYGCFGLALGIVADLAIGSLWSPDFRTALAAGFLSTIVFAMVAAVTVIRYRTIAPGTTLDGVMIGVVTFSGALELLIKPLLSVEFDSKLSLFPLVGQFSRGGAILLAAVCLVWFPRRNDRLLFFAMLLYLLAPASEIALIGRVEGRVASVTSWENAIGWSLGLLAVTAIARRARRAVPEPDVPEADSRAHSFRRLAAVSAAAVTIEMVVAVQAALQPGFSWVVVVSIIALWVLIVLRLQAAARLSEQFVERTRERDRLHAVVNLSTAIVKADSAERLLGDIGQATARALDRTRAEVSLFAPDGAETRVVIDECAGTSQITEIAGRAGDSPSVLDRLAWRGPFVTHPDDLQLPQELRQRWTGIGMHDALVIPMATERGLFGFLAVWEPGDRRGFDSDDIATAVAIAQEGSLAIQNSQLLHEARRRAEERALLLRVSQAASSSLELRTVLNEIANTSLRVAGIECMSIEIWDADANELVIHAQTTIPQWPGVDPPGTRFAIDHWPKDRQALIGRTPVRYTRNSLDLDEPARAALATEDIGTIVLFPLWAGEERLGLLKIFSRDLDAFGPDDVKLIQDMSGQTALAIHNSRLLESERVRADERAVLLRVTKAATSSLDLYTVLAEIAESTLGVAGIECTAVELWHPESDELEIGAQATIPEWPGVDEPGTRYSVGYWERDRELLTSRNTILLSLNDAGLDEASRMRMTEAGTGCLLVIPLWIGDRCLGVLDLFARREHAFGEATRRLGLEIAAQTALAIHNARLLETEHTRANEWAILHRVGLAAASSLDVRTVLTEIAWASLDIPGAECCAITLWDPIARQFVVEADVAVPDWPGREAPGTRYDELHSAIGYRALFNRAASMFDISSPDLSAEDRAHIRTFGMASLVVIPIYRHEETIGVFYLSSRQPRALNADTLRIGQEIASQTALAIHNARLLAVERHRGNDWAVLHQVGLAAASSLDLRTVLTQIAQASLAAAGAESCAITLWDAETRQFVLEADVAVPNWACTDELGTRYDESDSVFGSRVRNSRTAVIADVRDPDMSTSSKVLNQLTGIESLVVIPIVRHEEAIGIFYLSSRRPNAFNDDTLRLGREIASHAALAIHNANLLESERLRGVEWSVLHRVSRAAVSSLDKQTVLNEVATACLGIAGTECCTIFSLDLVKQEMIVEADVATPGWPGLVDPGSRFPLVPGAAEFKAMAARQPIIVEADDPDLVDEDREVMAEYGMKSIVIIPTWFSNEDTGIIYLASPSLRAFDKRVIRLGAEIGVQVALAFNNARLLDSERQRSSERSALLRVSQAATSSLDLQPVLAEIAQATLGVAGIESCDVMLWCSESDEFEIGADATLPVWPGVEEPGTRYPVGSRSFDRRVLQSRTPIVIGLADPDLPKSDRAELERYGAGSLAIFPLWIGANPVGVLEVLARRVNAFNAATMRIGSEIAVQTALAIQNAQLLQESRRYAAEQSALLRVSRAVSAGIELREVMNEVALASLAIAGAECCEIELLHPGEAVTEIIAAQVADGWRHGTTPIGKRLDLQHWQITRRVIDRREPVIIDAESPHLTPHERQTLFDNKMTCALLLPMVLDDRCLGVVCCYADRPRAFSRDSIRLGLDLASQAAMAIERRRLQDALEEQANTDGLTGLLNHRAIQDRLDAEVSRAYRSESSLAVLMIDLNRFKYVNDTHGHTTGDRVLRRAAQLLRASVRSYDEVGRYGGDEFMVILPDTDMLEAIEIAERISASAASAAASGSLEGMPISLSVGLAVFPIHAATRQELIDAADRAMYQAKRRRGNQVVAGPALLPTVAD